jgi:hypothetical protein
VLILKGVKVVCFDTLLQVLILKAVRSVLERGLILIREAKPLGYADPAYRTIYRETLASEMKKRERCSRSLRVGFYGPIIAEWPP